MKRIVLMMLTILVLAPLMTTYQSNNFLLENRQNHTPIVPSSQVQYASPKSLNYSLQMPDYSRFAVAGNHSWIQMGVGEAKDPDGYLLSDIRFSMIRRDNSTYSHFTDTIEFTESGWPQDNGMKISSTNPINDNITVAYTICNRETAYSGTRGSAYPNYNDPFCSDDGYDSDGALIEFHRFSLTSNQSTKLGTLSYDNCGYNNVGYTVNPPNYQRKIASGIVDNFKIQGFDNTGFRLAITHKHMINPSVGVCEILFNGTSLGQLPSSSDPVMDIIQVNRNGNSSLLRLQHSTEHNYNNMALNNNHVIYTKLNSGRYDTICFNLQSQTIINTHSGWSVLPINAAPKSILVPIRNNTHDGLLNTNNCTIVYAQLQSIFGDEIPVVWSESDNLTRIISFKQGTSTPFNLLLPTGAVSGTYLALILPNGTLHSVTRSTIPTPPSERNSGIGVFPVGEGESYILDSDYDSHADFFDFFPYDGTEWYDYDNDGFGNNIDECETVFGTSSVDILGCPDSDNDGTSNINDAFMIDPTQQKDTDFDGYGDNLSGINPDACISTPGISYRDRNGCLDSDSDGQSDLNDFLVFEPSQWNDSDLDGYGDNLYGYQGDKCPTINGNSTKDRYGCIDSDGDGYSDLNDDLMNEPTQWSDRDGDGYGDNQQVGANMIDYFPSDGTQWNDTDGDGHGDNPYGSQGDWFPNDPNRWQDSDQDGVANEDDAFPNNPTQSTDSDGDGYGDNPNGTDYDDFPFDANEWLDTDNDGIGDNMDQYPYDPSQTIDSDGDGYGDNTNGTRGDAFPDDGSEWVDTDGDGVGDNSDDLPFNPSQTVDTDGDGFGNEPTGTGADPFPNDPTQWVDADGDGYGDNAEGNNSDMFPRDITQWFDRDGDGFGDNQNGVNSDAFPNDSTQWVDDDGDGLGDNPNGTNPDPSINDYDNDGYLDNDDPFPQISSPGDKDNDGVLDENDAFPNNFREFSDNDDDGEGDIEDLDDDNDGYLDEDELRSDSDPLDPKSQPVEGFEIIVPGTAISLGAWDLIGMFGGIPLFGWIAFGFATRNGRCARYEELLNSANSRDELEQVALRWEYSLMLRMLGPHQGIRLERLRAELDDKFENENYEETEISYDQTNLVENEGKDIPPINESTSVPTKETEATSTDDSGYEWFKQGEENWYRPVGSDDEWLKFEN